jgi:hypothetical protein
MLGVVLLGCALGQFLYPEPRVVDFDVDGEGHLVVEIEERGEGEIGGGIAFIAEGVSLEVQGISGPGTYVSEARIFGRDRLVSVRLDPFAIAHEMSEQNQVVARRINVPYDGRGDLAITDLDHSASLVVTFTNVGEGTVYGGDRELRVYEDGVGVDDFTVWVPDLEPGASTVVATGYSYADALIQVSLKAGDDDADTTNGWRREHLTKGPSLGALRALFAKAEIRDATVWHYDKDGKVVDVPYKDWPNDMHWQLEHDYAELLEGRDPLGPRPVRDASECLLSYAESIRVYIAYLAQSAFFELHGGASWSLLDLPYEQRKMILGNEGLIETDPTRPDALDCWRSTLNTWSPAHAFGFLRGNDFIRGTAKDTLFHFGDFIRDNFEHGLVIDPERGAEASIMHYGTKYPRLEAFLYAALDDTNVTTGCGGTVAMLKTALRTINIPVEHLLIDLEGSHNSARFPSLGLRLVHGDDLYGTYGYLAYAVDEIMPTEIFFMDEGEFQAELEHPSVECVGGVCNTESVQRNLLAYRFHAYNRIAVMPTDLLWWIIDARPELDALLRGNPASVVPAVPDSARDILYEVAVSRVKLWGFGDYELGRERYPVAHDAVRKHFRQLRLP